MSLLRDRQREKALCRRVRAEVKASPALKKERRRVKKLAQRQFPQWLWRLALPAWLASMMVTASPVEWILAIATLWGLGFVLIRAASLWNWLYVRTDLLVLTHLPTPSELIFRRQLRGFLQESLWTWFDFSVFYGIAAMHVGFGWNAIAVGIGLGGLHWLTVCAAAGVVARVWPSGEHFHLGVCFCAIAIGFGIAARYWKPVMTGMVDFLLWAPPTGWIAYALGISPPDTLLVVIWPAVILGLLFASFPFHRLRRDFLMCDRAGGSAEILLHLMGPTQLPAAAAPALIHTGKPSRVSTGTRPAGWNAWPSPFLPRASGC
jgi:hypothetical protein